VDTSAGTSEEQMAGSTPPELQSYLRREVEAQFVEVMVLERRHGTRRLRDFDDDDDDNGT